MLERFTMRIAERLFDFQRAALHHVARRRRLTAENWEVCGEVCDGLEAIEAARRLAPDLIVIDRCMPGMTGLEAARKIRAEVDSVTSRS